MRTKILSNGNTITIYKWEEEQWKVYDVFNNVENIIDIHIDSDEERSVTWSIQDFLELEVEGWTITEEQAKDALADMMHHHDCNYGITWDTVDYFYKEHGTKIK